MPSIEIYWDDLTEAKQKEILEFLGDNGNFDTFPIATVEYGQTLDTTININLIATYEQIVGVAESERITEYFGDYGQHFFKVGIYDEDIRPVLDKALTCIGLTEEEYKSREREFMYRTNVENEINRQIELENDGLYMKCDIFM